MFQLCLEMPKVQPSINFSVTQMATVVRTWRRDFRFDNWQISWARYLCLQTSPKNSWSGFSFHLSSMRLVKLCDFYMIAQRKDTTAWTVSGLGDTIIYALTMFPIPYKYKWPGKKGWVEKLKMWSKKLLQLYKYSIGSTQSRLSPVKVSSSRCRAGWVSWSMICIPRKVS